MTYDHERILAIVANAGTLDDPAHKHLDLDGRLVPCREPQACADDAATYAEVSES